MRVLKTLTLAAVVCLSVGAFADSQFSNAGGTLASALGVGGYYLATTPTGSSALTNVSGVDSLNCSGKSACNGSVSYMTGLTSGVSPTLIDNVGLPPTTLTGPGSFTISGDGGTGPGGVVFSGTFTDATWTYSGTCTKIASCKPPKGVKGYYEWTLSGNVTGTYYVNGVMFQGAGATVQLTSQQSNTDPFKNGTGSIGLASGGTTLPTVPEPGTLALLGTGLVGIGMLAKRRGSSRSGSPGSSVV